MTKGHIYDRFVDLFFARLNRRDAEEGNNKQLRNAAMTEVSPILPRNPTQQTVSPSEVLLRRYLRRSTIQRFSDRFCSFCIVCLFPGDVCADMTLSHNNFALNKYFGDVNAQPEGARFGTV